MGQIIGEKEENAQLRAKVNYMSEEVEKMEIEVRELKEKLEESTSLNITLEKRLISIK